MDQKDRRVLVAMGEPDHPGGVPTLILAIPDGAWEEMADGKTHTFDFTSVGIRAHCLMFRGTDYADILGVLQKTATAIGVPLENGDLQDLGIKTPSKQ